MNCDECEDQFEKDGVIPDCETDRGCLLPVLSEDNRRVMEIREKLISLKGLVDPGTVLNMYGATRSDIEMIALMEETLGELKSEKKEG